MSESAPQPELFSASVTRVPDEPAASRLRLLVRLNAAPEELRLDWFDGTSDAPVAQARVHHLPRLFEFYNTTWVLNYQGRQERSNSTFHRSSIRARINWLRRLLPVRDEDVNACVGAEGHTTPMPLPADVSPWMWLERRVMDYVEGARGEFQRRLAQPPCPDDPPELQKARAFAALQRRFHAPAAPVYRLRFTMDGLHKVIDLDWSEAVAGSGVARLRVRVTGRDELMWELNEQGQSVSRRTSCHRQAIRNQLARVQQQFPTARQAISARAILPPAGEASRPRVVEGNAWTAHESPWDWLEEQIHIMADELRAPASPMAQMIRGLDPEALALAERRARRAELAERRQQELEVRMREAQARRAEERRRREAARQARDAKAPAKAKAAPPPAVPGPSARPRLPVPPVSCAVDLPPLEVQDTLLPLRDLRGYFLRERAALWWVSNQSDDLLCLPYCRIQRLEYQLRTALRVLGPLRGRALLSDEVGLGKTIEAGLVLKEYLTRGLVKRFLILTVPSLVDQWEEELDDKFSLPTATTNHASFRADPAAFWQAHPGIVASLHTLKQPAHLAVAQSIHWDLLVVDEAHYLRNRASQAWQAVNALPRRFLLLLTATPVQNSLEELYNLVTLLQPGQLPSPREFRERFVEKGSPHRPRDAEELRRLLGQVMVRNTRANAGLQLPPRRAETVQFEPDATEREFWQAWEAELRASLARLGASQASLWGRLLLQSAGSSPAAWREALRSFPDGVAARAWSERAPLESSWVRKCQAMLPLAKVPGGVVIFTQFLHTQSALADALRAAGVLTWVINGQTPAPERQPITEQFREQGGALLLTQSGTEGRNLQHSHHLVNFDLPWNPMEIEQRIGRLHRLGQQQPVRIYSLVQAGTLQEHLLKLLQEKLNLFELVVGETGLILGERFSSEEFAEEVLRRWRESDGRVGEAFQALGEELAAARSQYQQVKELDATLFAKDYESL